MAFIELKSELKQWDPDLITNDVKNLLESSGYDWIKWRGRGVSSLPGQPITLNGDLNLTSHPTLCKDIHERMFKHSGREYKDSRNVEHRDLYVMHPELEGTYTGDMIKYLQDVFGTPVRVRLHNKVNHYGLYWHVDPTPIRYHLVMWTYPGAFMVWTDEKLQWHPTFDPEQCTKEFTIHTKFMPKDGLIYAIDTIGVAHGVANIGVGWSQSPAEQSRCHFTFWPVVPRI